MKSKINIQGLMNQLEHEKERVRKLTEKNDAATKAVKQLEDIFSAFMIDMAISFGEKKEENGALLGYCLTINKINIDDTLGKWVSQVREVNGKMVLGIAPREEQNEAEQ